MGISVIIPTYNRAAFTSAAIDSVLAQTLPPDEILVIDDGSSDDTEQALRHRFGERIRYVSQANQGPSAARNHGMRLAREELVAFLDSDDLWRPSKLQVQHDFLTQNPTVDFVFCDLWVGDESDGGIEIQDRNFHDQLVNQQTHLSAMVEVLISRSFTITTTLMFRRRCWDTCGPFDESMRLCEDMDLWLRAAAQYKWGFVPVPLAERRRHEGNLVNDWIKREEARLAVIQKFLVGPWSDQVSDEIVALALRELTYDLGSAQLRAGRFKAARTTLEIARERGCRAGVLPIKLLIAGCLSSVLD